MTLGKKNAARCGWRQGDKGKPNEPLQYIAAMVGVAIVLFIFALGLEREVDRLEAEQYWQACVYQKGC